MWLHVHCGEKPAFSLITMWVGPFEVAEMGQKSVGLDRILYSLYLPSERRLMERTIHWEGTEQLLPHMKTPALVIWGNQDTVLDPHLYLPRWHTLDPSAKIVEINQAGHAVQVDQPEQVNQLLLNFLAS